MVSKKTFEAVAAQFRKSQPLVPLPLVPLGADADALTAQEFRARCVEVK